MIDRIREAEGGVAVAADDWKENALVLAATARERLIEAGRTVNAFVTKEPFKAIGLALGMGVVLGWLVKRR